MRQIIIDKGLFTIRIAILENGELVDYRMESINIPSKVGQIYKGRVTDVLPGMDAAFVNIGSDKNAYLGKMDIVKNGHRGRREDTLRDLIKVGDEILVEVSKDETNTKGAKLTMRLSLKGKHMVLMPEDNHVGISRQISDDTVKTELLNWAKDMLHGTSHGLIIRTSAEMTNIEQRTVELNGLLKQWEELKNYRVLGNAPQCIYQGAHFAESVLQDEMKYAVSEIICNDKMLTQQLDKYVKRLMPSWSDLVTYYDDDQPLFQSTGIDVFLNAYMKRRINIKGGGYLIVDETEALTVVDVNSGEQVGKKHLDQTAFNINKKAAREMARLLKIRELSGIVLIDFIGMNDVKLQEKLVNELKVQVKKDRNRVTVYGLTQLGIMELTRKKTVESTLARYSEPHADNDTIPFNYAPVHAIDHLLEDLNFKKNHYNGEHALYGVSKSTMKYIRENAEKLRIYLNNIGMKLIVTERETLDFERLMIGTEEKINIFAKKTGNLELFHI